MPSRRPSWSPQAFVLLCVLTTALALPSARAYGSILDAVPLKIYASDCDGVVDFCLDAEATTTLTANGRLLTPVEACAERALLSLDVTQAFMGLARGPYEVVWKVGPGAYRTRLASRDSLLSFLRGATPEANWRKTADGRLLAESSESYGALVIIDAGTSATTRTELISLRLVTDRAYRLPVGTYRLIATGPGGADTRDIEVLCTPTEKRRVSILKDVRGLHCLPSTAPPDTYTLTILQAPAVANVGVVKTLGLCLEFVGVATGVTQGLFEVCHTPTGKCVRYEITFAVTGGQPLARPVLMADYLAVAYNGQDMMDVLRNDRPGGEVTSLVISTESLGEARVDGRNRIHYSSPINWCGNDSLRYIACTAGGCEEATVRIQVSCEKLIVFTGFSPNGDGINDHFIVLGLENHPDNQLTIFNEYGNQVYTKTGYANDWTGLSHGAPLAGGTYYYVLTVKGFQMMNGYVQLQR